MKKNLVLLMVILILGALLVTACSTTPEPIEDDQAAGEHMDDDEHDDGDEHAHVSPPHEFEDLSNPYGADDHEIIEAGEAIYEVNCAACHGFEGEGDGPAAGGLDPKPASLSEVDMMAELSDGYLFWRVSEGGAFEPFNSAMPPWKDVLSEDERWQVITFLRSLSADEH